MLSLAIILIGSIFFTGIVGRVKSRLAGRMGPGLLQPMRDIVRNLRKGSVYSETSGLVFRVAPSIMTASLFIAALCIPLGPHPGVFSFRWDFVFFAYTMALGKFFMVIAALDTGSSFEGMGASREALFSLLIEPAIFMLMGSFALFSGYGSFVNVFAALHGDETVPGTIGMIMSALSAFVIMLVGMVENSRMPVDDPRTHLELTMIHEVMILDTSGFDLGLVMYAGCLRFAVFGTLAADFFISPRMGIPAAMVFALVFTAGYAVFVGVLESVMARFRMRQNPQYIFTITVVTLLVFLGAVMLAGNI